MSLLLPLRTDLPHYDFQMNLDGRLYTLELKWNRREGYWYLDIRLEDGTPVVVGLKVVIDQPLGCRCKLETRLKGALFAIDTSTQHLDPGETELGDRVVMVYFTADELPIDPTQIEVE